MKALGSSGRALVATRLLAEEAQHEGALTRLKILEGQPLPETDEEELALLEELSMLADDVVKTMRRPSPD